MDILEEKDKIQLRDLYYLFDNLQYNNNVVNLVGSSSLKSQYYFSDYDFNSSISKKQKPTEIKGKIEDILKELNEDENNYFIEMKIEYTDDKKKLKVFKYNDINNLSIEDYENINILKLDYIVKFNYEFIEVSMIYIFSNKTESKKNMINYYKDEIKELVKSGKYFKALKRVFSINKLNNKKDELVKLTKFFNSNFGKMYKIISNLNTIKILLDNYKDKKIIKQVINNLKIYNIYNIEEINKYINKYSKIYNKEAKNIYNGVQF